MPLTKRTDSTAQVTPVAAESAPSRLGGEHKAGDRAKSLLTKDEYWTRREERDIQRDKDMAWSGLAQAALQSVGILQLNTSNTLEGLLALVNEATTKLLAMRPK